MDESVARAGIFTRLEPQVVAAITARLQPVDYRRGRAILLEGEPGDRLYIIAAGKVKIGCRAPDGRQLLLAVLGPREIFGELAVVDPAPRTSTAFALTDVRLMSMHGADLRTLLVEHPRIAEQLLRVLARRLKRTSDDQLDYLFTDAFGRVAKRLLKLAQQFGVQHDGAIRVPRDLTQGEIAQLVRSGRVTVNKALREFSRRGWIRADGTDWLILDSERLAQRARRGL